MTDQELSELVARVSAELVSKLVPLIVEQLRAEFEFLPRRIRAQVGQSLAKQVMVDPAKFLGAEVPEAPPLVRQLSNGTWEIWAGDGTGWVEFLGNPILFFGGRVVRCAAVDKTKG